MNTQTLRERFEQNIKLSAVYYFDKTINQYRVNPELGRVLGADISPLNQAWRWYQSGAENNQCVVELQEPVMVRVAKDSLQRVAVYPASEVIAAIKASGARIK